MRSEDLLHTIGEYSDFYVVGKGFKWTYVIPYEEDWGPHFYRKLQGDLKDCIKLTLRREYPIKEAYRKFSLDIMSYWWRRSLHKSLFFFCSKKYTSQYPYFPIYC